MSDKSNNGLKTLPPPASCIQSTAGIESLSKTRLARKPAILRQMTKKDDKRFLCLTYLPTSLMPTLLYALYDEVSILCLALIVRLALISQERSLPLHPHSPIKADLVLHKFLPDLKIFPVLNAPIHIILKDGQSHGKIYAGYAGFCCICSSRRPEP